MDPLTLLQDYASRNDLDNVRLTDARVEFEDSYTFPKDTLTAYRGRQGKGDFYSVASLLVYLRNVKIKMSDYFASAKLLNVPTVAFVDRKELTDYLTQPGATSAHVQQAALDLHLAGQPQDGSAPAAKRARLATGDDADADEGGEETIADENAALLADIVKHERDMRDRNSAMSVPNKRFTRGLELGAKALQQMNPNNKQQQAPKQLNASSRQSTRQPAVQLPVRPSGRYERGVGENTAVMDVEGSMRINTFLPTSQAKAAVGGASGHPPPPPPGRPPASSGAPPPPPPLSERRHSSSHSNGHAKSPAGKPAHRGDKRPIVLVPKGYETKLNMFNAQQFLQDGRFCMAEDVKKEGAKKLPEAVFQRTIGCGRPQPYVVSEKAPDKGDRATWSRVVAVFVQGKEWQFRDWPFAGVSSGDMVDTFNRMQGVYLTFQNEEVPALVKKWNVRILRLHPNDRHGDVQTVRQFYTYLDALIETRSKKA